MYRSIYTIYMTGFSQPQHFFAAECIFVDFSTLCRGPSALLLETFFVDPFNQGFDTSKTLRS